MITATRRIDGKPETEADRKFFDLRASGYRGPIDQDGNADPVGPHVAILRDLSGVSVPPGTDSPDRAASRHFERTPPSSAAGPTPDTDT